VAGRFSGRLKSERLYRATIGDGNPLAAEVNLFRRTCNTLRPTRPPANAYHVRLSSPSNTAISVWSLAPRPDEHADRVAQLQDDVRRVGAPMTATVTTMR
jgi:hypothetical protein